MKTVVLTQEQIHTGPLVLVNRTHPLQPAYQSDLVVIGQNQEIQLERQAAHLLAACIQSVGGENAIVPVSGWHSQAEQQGIWDDTWKQDGEAFTRKYVAFPGCSEHQSGLAIDLAKAAPHIDFIRPNFPYAGIYGAFRRAAARYGFIERYQKEKSVLTGIAAEPWHFRYVGVPHAQLIEQYRLCLEEYAAFLKQGPRRCTLENGKTATVFYVPCKGDETQAALPDGCCQISGDNADGFIVTHWEAAP